MSKELRDFLHYLENTTDQAAAISNSKRIRRIHNRVCKVKQSEEVSVKYMQAWEEKYYAQEEARQEGLAEGREQGRGEERKYNLINLICKKIKKNCSVAEIADMLEEEESTIQIIYDTAKAFSPDYNLTDIINALPEEV